MKRSKTINTPKVGSDLAYLCGVLAGDGYIGIRKHKHEYLINCGGNPNDEKEFYDEIIAPLFFKLFNLKVKPKLLGKTYGINIWSKNLVEFLIKDVGLSKSPKNNLSVPRIFLENKKLALHFIRGVADSDFSFQIKKRNYPVIKGSSKCKEFIVQIGKLLEENSFKVGYYLDYKIKDSRLKKGFNIINRIELNGRQQFLRWISLIGTRQNKNRIKIRNYKSSGGRI